MGGAFSADGRRVLLLVALPDETDPEFASRWSLTDIDAADGTVRDTGIGGYFPAPVDALSGGFADDGGSAVLWDTGGTAAPTLIDLTGGRTAVARPERRSVASLDVRPIPGGAAQFWEDGVVTLFDSSGAPVQQLAAPPRAGSGRRRRTGRDLGGHRRRRGSSRHLGHRPGDRQLVAAGRC